MLEAIGSAERTIALSTYMFGDDPTGSLFIEALATAVERKIRVKVLVDAFGSLLSWPPVQRRLRRENIEFVSFNPLWRPHQLSSRYHRKMLVVDGRVGFTGGMNIRQNHVITKPSYYPVADMHFMVEGPLVAEMFRVFANDWLSATGQLLDFNDWPSSSSAEETMLARQILSGPDSGQEARAIITRALTRARKEAVVLTPYFFPDLAVMNMLKKACSRGARIKIVVPQDTWFLFKWAFTPALRDLLECGCRILLSGPVFDHSKAFIVDGTWSMVGSTNWDSRSLNWNYEFDMEVYDSTFASSLLSLVHAKERSAEELSIQMIDRRRSYEKLRDKVAHLLFPLL